MYEDNLPLSATGEVGKRIYMDALSDRRGFRDGQLGIDDPEVWQEIFENIGQVAVLATKR